MDSPRPSGGSQLAGGLFGIAIQLGLVVTVAAGVVLRLQFAGWIPPHGNLANLRHAHSHGGIYIVLFLLAVLTWRARGVPTPGARTFALYIGASAVAVPAFAVQGYGLVSIAASTLVGSVWLLAAYAARGLPRREQGALRLMPIALLAATLFVPPIALSAGSDPGLARALARSFLATLILLAFVPVALRSIGARSLDARLFAPAAALAAAHLGPLPTFLGSAGLVVVAAQVAWSVWSGQVRVSSRAAWLLFSVGAVMLACWSTPPYHLALGGLHYLLLGPLFASLAGLTERWTWLVATPAALMAAFLGSLELGGPAAWAHGAAGGAGALWGVVALLGWIGGKQVSALQGPPVTRE